MLAHVDADSFFASVLVRTHPSLRGKPVLALGMGGGCVIAASYEAKAKGVKTGMRLSDALVLCPEALHMNSDFRETGLASDQIESILQDQCPIIEQYSVDEWFLDLKTCVGNVPTDLNAWAQHLRIDILKRTGLSVSAGIGSSKLLAKMASEYRKPGGVTVVVDAPNLGASTTIETFLRDRPATAIPGIGHARSIHCERMGWITAWDIACAHNDQLREHFGRPGIDLKRELNGEVLSSVRSIPALPKSISRARSFHPVKDHQMLWAHVLRHLEYTVLKMRRQSLACRGLSVWLRDSRYTYESSHLSLTQQLDTEEHLQPYVMRCFKRLWNRNMGYTQAGLSLWALQARGDTQLSLFEDPQKTLEDESLQKSLDEVHDRYGRDAVTHASALPVKSGTKRGFEMPAINDG